jgi:hypothetical protein
MTGKEKDLEQIIQKHEQLLAMKESVIKFAQDLERSEHEYLKTHFGFKDGDQVNMFKVIQKAMMNTEATQRIIT